jgi:type I restriction enzyme S subunit
MKLGSEELRAEARHWHGNVPAGWAARKFKQVARVREGQVDPEDERYRNLPLFAPNHIESGTGRILDVETATEQGAESGKYLVDPGDVLYSKIRPALRKVALAPSAGLCSADMYPIKPGPELDERFLFYSMLAEGFFRYSLLESARVAMPKINRDALGACVLLLPLRAEQRAIADFLDRKTAAIDVIIDKKERLIALLEERRHAAIWTEVTKGVNANAPVRESGHEWIGGIPAHWDVARTRHVARLESGHTPSRRRPEYWVPEECTIPWVSLADVWQIREGKVNEIRETAEKVSPLGVANSAARVLPAGTVIVSRTASVGFSAIISEPMATTQDFVNWICGPRLRPKYLLYVFRAMRDEFRRLTMGSTHQTIYMPDVARFVTPVPPVTEQDVIITAIELRLSSLDALAAAVTDQIGKLREYRQALITAAVTGQLDVAAQEAA